MICIGDMFYVQWHLNTRTEQELYSEYKQDITRIMQDNHVKNKILELYEQSINHDGYSGFSVTIKILKRNQREVIIDAGLQYRFVIGEVANNKGIELNESIRL